MFEDEFSLESIKNLIITLNIDPEEAINAITGFLRDNYDKDKKAVMLQQNLNANISKRMNYYVDGDTWYIRIRKEKTLQFADNDYVTLNVDVTKEGVNKIVFSIETTKRKVSKIRICPMHENRLNTKVSSNLSVISASNEIFS